MSSRSVLIFVNSMAFLESHRSELVVNLKNNDWEVDIISLDKVELKNRLNVIDQVSNLINFIKIGLKNFFSQLSYSFPQTAQR